MPHPSARACAPSSPPYPSLPQAQYHKALEEPSPIKRTAVNAEPWPPRDPDPLREAEATGLPEPTGPHALEPFSPHTIYAPLKRARMEESMTVDMSQSVRCPVVLVHAVPQPQGRRLPVVGALSAGGCACGSRPWGTPRARRRGKGK